MGATKTSVSCVEEGWVLPDTRIQLAIGGDDITSVLAGMLRKQNFPYKDLNLNCTWEWQMIEQLKEDMLVLSEGDVGLNSFTFFVRHPQKPTVKWSVRAYDEVIIPAMVNRFLFFLWIQTPIDIHAFFGQPTDSIFTINY
jgi:actin-related protein 8